MKRYSIGLAVLVAALIAPAIGLSAQDQTPVSDQSTVCQYPIANSGSGEKFFRACISTTSNLVDLRYPAGSLNHVGGDIVEGYAVCDSAGVHGWDSANGGAGFNAPVVLASSSSSVTISRTTTSGVYELIQKWTRDVSERDVTVLMTLKNRTAVTRTGVTLSRYADIDADENSSGQFFDRTNYSIWGRAVNGVSMNATSAEVPHNLFLEFYSSLSTGAATGTKTGCTPAAQAAPNTGDLAGRINYTIGNLNALKSTAVKVTYRRQ